jgi:asparagine synthase (glutamine-hydrolysing)
MVYHGDSVAPNVIQSMTEALRHRGPDSKGVHVTDKGGIGVRRLRIIDLATGDQPIHNEDNSCHIVFNGEIYNYQELRSNLLTKGHSFYTQSDTEVIVHLYEDLGESSVNLLDGMFAFCIWDLKNESFFLARDRIGEKPLYYMSTDKEFVFASEPKSILQYPSYVPEVDLDSLKRYLVYGYVPSPWSLFKGMKKLEPGSSLLVTSNGKLALRSYYKFTFKKQASSPISIEERASKEIEKAVKSRLVSDVRVGVLLSGGIDSSLIAYFVSRVAGPKAIEAFTIGFRNMDFDESAHAMRVASQLGLPHSLTMFNEEDVVNHVEEALSLLDEPIADPSFIPTYLLSKVAGQSVRVVLTGDGGDELFGGYPKYRIHKLLRSYDGLPHLLKAPLSTLLARMPESIFGQKAKRILMTLPQGTAERNMLWISPFLPNEARHLFPLFESLGPLELTKQEAPLNPIDPVEVALQSDIRYSLGDLFLSKVDRASMACSLEARTPFVASSLLEFAAGVPSKEKVRLTGTKILLRKLALQYLPRENIFRRKQGFGIPIAAWMRGPMKQQIEVALSNEKLERHGLFSTSYVRSIIDAHLSHKKDNSIKIWSLLVFQVWFDRWIWNGKK